MLLAALLALASESVSATRPAAPAAHCLDARQVGQSRHLSDRLLLARDAQQAFRIELAESCPPNGDAQQSLLAPHGWVCGGEDNFLRNGGQICGIAKVEPISFADFSALLRAADTNAEGEIVLAPVQIEAKVDARRRFAGSPEYCVDPRQVRGWNVIKDGLELQTSPRRSGGHKRYRVELGRSCPEFTLAGGLMLRSGVGIGWICGNAGDLAIAVPESSSGEFANAALFAQPSVAQGCPIVSVLPILDNEEDDRAGG